MRTCALCGTKIPLRIGQHGRIPKCPKCWGYLLLAFAIKRRVVRSGKSWADWFTEDEQDILRADGFWRLGDKHGSNGVLEGRGAA